MGSCGCRTASPSAATRGDLRQEQAGGMQFLHLCSALQSSCRGPAPHTSLQRMLGRWLFLLMGLHHISGTGVGVALSASLTVVRGPERAARRTAAPRRRRHETASSYPCAVLLVLQPDVQEHAGAQFMSAPPQRQYAALPAAWGCLQHPRRGGGQSWHSQETSSVVGTLILHA